MGGAGDVLDALGVQIEPRPPRSEPPAGVAGRLWAELRRRPRRRDALALATGLTADVTTAALPSSSSTASWSRSATAPSRRSSPRARVR